MLGCESVVSRNVGRCCPYCHRRRELATRVLVRSGYARVCCYAAHFVRQEQPDAIAGRAVPTHDRWR
jgi:hypothetical protein